MSSLLLVMRAVHVLSGVFWAGAVFFLNFLLGPSVNAAGPEGAKVMMELRRRRYFEIVLGVGAFTILSGLVLVWIDSSNFGPGWFATRFGMGISTGMLAAIVAWLMGMFAVKPAMEAVSSLGQQMAQAPSDQARGALAPQFDAARRRIVRNGAAAAHLLLVAVLAMAVARYL
jgi:uncharacterized membrane protein